MAGIMVADQTSNVTAALAGTTFLGLAWIWFTLIAFIVLVAILLFVFWIIMLIDCIQRKPDDFPEGGDSAKTIWLVILTVTFFIGNLNGIAAIVYYFVVKRKMPRKQ
jgi:hypothetical protein